jgi:hypothetical protein
MWITSEQGTTFGAVSGDRKQTTYAFVSWRVARDTPAISRKANGVFSFPHKAVDVDSANHGMDMGYTLSLT